MPAMPLRFFAPACTVLLAVTALPAWADEAAAAPADAGPAQLDKITITATPESYRATAATSGVLGEQPLLDTPYSIAVIGRQLIDNQQAATYGDYLKNDPSTSIGNVPVGFANIRGFNVGTDGYLYDGLAGNLGLSDGRYQIENLDRIEVLKGPSAFLYGLGASSSVGGAINFIPKRPLDAPVRSASFGYTGRSLYGATLDVGDRFGAERQFGYRVNLGYKDGEQAVKDADWTHKSASLSLDWQASKDLQFTAIYEYANNHFPQLQPFFALAPGVAVPAAPDAHRNIAQPWDDFRTTADNVYLRSDWRIDDAWSLTAQALHSEDQRPRVKDARFGFILNSDGDAQLFGSEDQSRTQEDSGQVLLHGKLSTAGIGHQLTLGLSGARYEAHGAANNALGVFDTNLYAPVDAAEPASAPIVVGRTQRFTSTGVLLSDIVSFTPQWSALLGARQAALTVKNYDPTTGQEIPPDSSLSRVSPTAALIYKPISNASLYANYAEGLEQGGKAPSGTTNANQYLSPVKTQQYEFGGKLELTRVNVSVALFDLKRPFEYVDAGSNTYVQSGEQEHRGLEITINGDLSDQLSLVAGAQLLDPRKNDTGDASSDGKRPVGVARLSANVFADYRIKALPGAFVNAGVYHSGKQYLDELNTQAIASWTRLDLGARYETLFGKARTSFLFGVENLQDKNYWAGAQSGILTLAEPRTFKATVRIDY